VISSLSSSSVFNMRNECFPGGQSHAGGTSHGRAELVLEDSATDEVFTGEVQLQHPFCDSRRHPFGEGLPTSSVKQSAIRPRHKSA
jgi:hypothetical protein